MPPGVRVDPYGGFRFHVQLGSLIVAGFSEVSGLDVEVETEEYQEGGRNSFTHELPGRASHPNLELRRGLTDSRSLIGWIEDVAAGRIERRNVQIFLLDSAGLPKWGWQCREAYPVGYTGPEFRADRGEVAMESLELTHRGLSTMGLGLGGV